jgi:hypothetical protein
MVKDPVCKMDVNEKTAKIKSEYKGTTYYFCNRPAVSQPLIKTLQSTSSDRKENDLCALTFFFYQFPSHQL